MLGVAQPAVEFRSKAADRLIGILIQKQSTPIGIPDVIQIDGQRFFAMPVIVPRNIAQTHPCIIHDVIVAMHDHAALDQAQDDEALEIIAKVAHQNHRAATDDVMRPTETGAAEFAPLADARARIVKQKLAEARIEYPVIELDISHRPPPKTLSDPSRNRGPPSRRSRGPGITIPTGLSYFVPPGDLLGVPRMMLGRSPNSAVTYPPPPPPPPPGGGALAHA